MGQIYNSDSIALSSGGGAPATFEAGYVESLPAGSEPTVSFDEGADGVQVVNFGIPEGQSGADGESFTWRDEYDSVVVYRKNDVVFYKGGSYIATHDASGWFPDNPNQDQWDLLAEMGSPGDAGPPNTLVIGTVTTLGPGEEAVAEIAGEAPNQVLNLGIPQGEPGESTSDIVIPEFGGPGDVGFFAVSTGATSDSYHPGDLIAASELLYSGVSDPATAIYVLQKNTAPSGGTWRCCGFAANQGNTGGTAVMPFIRIDGTQLAKASAMRGACDGGMIRNCQYSSADNTLIDCEIENDGVWIPFTAWGDDCTDYGPEIYKNAVAGEYGSVAVYVPPVL